MTFIAATDEGLIIPYETAIALYHLGLMDGALLANVLPIAIVQAQCPEVMRDLDAIARVNQALKELTD